MWFLKQAFMHMQKIQTIHMDKHQKVNHLAIHLVSSSLASCVSFQSSLCSMQKLISTYISFFFFNTNGGFLYRYFLILFT